MKSCKENNFIMIINNHIDFELEEKQMQYGLAFECVTSRTAKQMNKPHVPLILNQREIFSTTSQPQPGSAGSSWTNGTRGMQVCSAWKAPWSPRSCMGDIT